MEIHSYLSSVLPAGTLHPWTPTTDEGHLCLEFSNRYFTSKSDNTHAAVSFTKEVDPLGLLEELTPELRHTEDNEVLYYERLVSSNPTCVVIAKHQYSPDDWYTGHTDMFVAHRSRSVQDSWSNFRLRLTQYLYRRGGISCWLSSDPYVY